MSRLRRAALAVVLLGPVWLACALYLLPPRHAFPAPRPFSGARWHNPYDGVDGGFRPLALHLHGRRWGGATFGEQASEAVAAHYRDAGFQWVVLTDYMHRTDEGVADLVAYEHGYNKRKAHQLALGARRVVWFDQPWPTRDGLQLVHDWLGATAEFVVVSHPQLLDGYPLEDLARLDGYDALEVASHVRHWTPAWDSALSAGRRVWGVAGDDSHDLDAPSETGHAWTEVSARDGTPAALLDALRAGRVYAVRREQPGVGAENALLRQSLEGDALVVEVARPADRLRCVGQGGEERAAAEGTNALRCAARPDDGYLRVEVVNGETVLFLQPVTRERGNEPVRVEWGPTALQWAAALLGLVAMAALARWLSRPRSAS